VVALAAAIVLPEAPARTVAALPAGEGRPRWLAATAIAALAWFGMTATMVFAPLGLAGCGIGLAGAVGAVAWHVVAMYGPAGAIAFLVARFGALPPAISGIALIAGAAATMTFAPPAGVTIVTALIVSGVGWSLATSGALVALHQSTPSRLAIAGHDAAILLAGIGGAFASLLMSA